MTNDYCVWQTVWNVYVNQEQRKRQDEDAIEALIRRYYIRKKSLALTGLTESGIGSESDSPSFKEELILIDKRGSYWNLAGRQMALIAFDEGAGITYLEWTFLTKQLFDFYTSLALWHHSIVFCAQATALGRQKNLFPITFNVRGPLPICICRSVIRLPGMTPAPLYPMLQYYPCPVSAFLHLTLCYRLLSLSRVWPRLFMPACLLSLSLACMVLISVGLYVCYPHTCIIMTLCMLSVTRAWCLSLYLCPFVIPLAVMLLVSACDCDCLIMIVRMLSLCRSRPHLRETIKSMRCRLRR